jgi:hypothetical protein
MKAIKDMWLIQIEITNSCFLECPNCTRFVGHNKKPYFMDLETVNKAIDSLEGFPGSVGIMGGEPTLHPQFSEICKLLQKRVPEKKRYIWTSGHHWKKYRAIIRQTFAENIYYNDHSGVEQRHQPVLMAIGDMINDRPLMKELIDKCWIQEKWSASINPKGGFFCEVAAAMDMLFEGPGGYALEKGWWDKTPAQFQDQVKRYCYNCGVALPMPSRLNKEGKDYVSISNYKRLQDLNSPRFLKDRVKLVEEKYSRAQVEEFAKNWQPWNYLGDQKRISYEQLYGLPFGFLIKIHKKINKKRKKIQCCLLKLGK